MEAEWIDLMPESVTIAPFGAMSPARDAIRHGDPVTVRAYVAATTKEVRTGPNETRTASTLLIPYGPIDPSDPHYPLSIQHVPGVQDLYTLPNGQTPHCMGVDSVYDDVGLHHYEIYLDAPPPRT